MKKPMAEITKEVTFEAAHYLHNPKWDRSKNLEVFRKCAGYRKDDPNGIWESDKYRLVLAPTHETMGGITEEHGSWAGQFFLRHNTDTAR